MVKTLKKIAALAGAVVLSATMLSGCAKEKEADTLVFGTNAEFPPFEYLADGKPVGVDMDIAKAIADELGVTLKIENVKFDTIISSVQSGKASLGAAGIT